MDNRGKEGANGAASSTESLLEAGDGVESEPPHVEADAGDADRAVRSNLGIPAPEVDPGSGGGLGKKGETFDLLVGSSPGPNGLGIREVGESNGDLEFGAVENFV